MDCRSATRLIPAYLDGELAPDRVAPLHEHLSSCSSCRARLAVLEQTMAAMGARRNIEPAFTLADIESHAVQQPTRRRWASSFCWFLPAPRWTTALAVAAAIFVGAVGGIGLHAVNQPTRPPAASSAVSDMLSLAASDDPLTDLMAERPSGSSSAPANSRQEGRL